MEFVSLLFEFLVFVLFLALCFLATIGELMSMEFRALIICFRFIMFSLSLFVSLCMVDLWFGLVGVVGVC